MLCLIVMQLLAGCATVSSRPVRTVVVARPICPPLKPYSAAMQAATADGLDHLPRDDPIATMIVDYGQLRAALRAACKRK